MTRSVASEIYYERLTWPEVKEAVKMEKVVLIPVGCTEDHGFHLPLDVDSFFATELCLGAARKAPTEMLVMPTISYTFAEHHMDFPGTVNVGMETLLRYVVDVAKSVAHHGFRKILLVNAHGANVPILDLASRQVVLQTNSICGSFIWMRLVEETLKEIRESEFPGGITHACEAETSLYLYLAPERVQMEKAVKEIAFPKSEFIWHDWQKHGPVQMQDWWTRISKTGVIGDPTLATAEKGRKLYEATTDRMVDLVREFKARLIPDRIDLHQD